MTLRAGHNEAAPAWGAILPPGRATFYGILAAAPFLGFLIYEWTASIFVAPAAFHSLSGLDFNLYIDAARRFLAGGSFYYPWQLAGPYGEHPYPILYPPELLALLIPFTVLPAVLWWLVPLAVTAAVIVRLRPRPWSWWLIAACLAWPPVGVKIIAGNPSLWVAMFVALGTLYRWPAAFGLLKVSLGPFALIGIRDRRWWIAAGIGALPFCWLLPEYLAALRNFVSPMGALYSLQEVPLVLIPVVAWMSRTR